MATGNFVTQAAALPFMMAGATVRLGWAGMRGMYRMGVESAKAIGGLARNGKDRVEDAASEVRSTFEDWGEQIEERVEDSLERLGVPVRADLDDLRRRVDELAACLKNEAKKALDMDGEPARTVLHVTPFDGKWQVKESGAEEARGLYDTKDAALKAARGLARAHEPSQLVVHRADGTIQRSYTYGEIEDDAANNEEAAN